MKRYLLLILAVVFCWSCSGDLDATKTEFSLEEQTTAAEDLIGRVVGKKAAKSFSVSIIPSKEGDRD